MNILAFRFTFFMAICLTLASVDGNTPLWVLSDPFTDYIFRPNLLRTIFSRRLRCPVSTFWS